MNSILIVGAQGFLGRQITGKLIDPSIKLSLSGRREEEGFFYCDLLSISDVKRLVNFTNPDLIINCAAFVPRNFSQYFDVKNVQVNVEILKNILSSSSCPILHISSMTVYNEHSATPGVWSENDAARKPISEYGLSKWESELLLNNDPRLTLSLRVPGLYGLGKKSGLIYNSIMSFKNYQLPQMPSDPVLWAAMHVDDLAYIVSALANQRFPPWKVLNCGYRDIYSINIFYKYLCEIWSYPDEDTDVNHPLFCFDLARLEKLNLVPNKSFRSSLVGFVAEFE